MWCEINVDGTLNIYATSNVEGFALTQWIVGSNAIQIHPQYKENINIKHMDTGDEHLASEPCDICKTGRFIAEAAEDFSKGDLVFYNDNSGLVHKK